MTQSKTLDTGSDGMEDRFAGVEIDIECARIMAMSEAEIDAHIRAQGDDPAEVVRRFDLIVRNAITITRLRNAMKAAILELQCPAALSTHPHTGGREAVTTALAFLDGIEGHGYGGMASFEIAREGLRALSPPLQKTQKEDNSDD